MTVGRDTNRIFQQILDMIEEGGKVDSQLVSKIIAFGNLRWDEAIDFSRELTDKFGCKSCQGIYKGSNS